MVNIYIGHEESVSKMYWAQLQESMPQCNFVFSGNQSEISKELLKGCSFLVAEATTPTIKLGIEIGLAHSFGIPILCLFQKGTALPAYILGMSHKTVEYTSLDEMTEAIDKYKNSLG